MSNQKILLVEASGTQAMVVTDALERGGHTVHRVVSAEAAIVYLQTERPALAVVDYHLPGMQGNAFCRLIRNNAATASIPLLVLTDDGEGRAESEALEGGADAYMAKSEDGEVLLARIDLLLRKAAAAASGNRAPSFYQAPAVLAVDDSATYLAFLEQELAGEGYRVFTATSGEAAVRVAGENSLDCAVVDLIMPGMDGIELCRRLTAHRDGEKTPLVLIVTARGSKDKMMEALEVGADDYVEKTGDVTVLKARLRALLRRKMLQDEHQRVRDEMRDKELEMARLKAAADERVHLLLDSVGEGVIGVDGAGAITFANRAALAMTGLSDTDILHLTLDRLFRLSRTASADGPPLESPIGATLRDGGAMQAVEASLGRADGTRFPVEMSSRPVVRDGALDGAVVSFEDISRRLEMEGRLVQSQKMEAVGRLTGGVAHDFNNLLTVIIGNLQLLQRSAGDEPKMAARLTKIMQAAKSGAELTRRLLSFSRQQVLETGTIDLNEVVRDTAEMVQRTIADNVVVTTAVAADPCLGITDRDQLAHALLNLCFNARDAMPKGGRLTLETRRATLDEGYAAAHSDVEPGEYIEIAVTDTGTGIKPEILEKIFEPFFTTKEKGKGTGLGLSTIFGFMKQSGGHISVYSELGRGSTFRLYVPIAKGGVTAAQPRAANGQKSRAGHRATVLVVEDEDGVRDVAITTLKDAGYTVVEAASGQAGLQALEAHPEVAVVFSDVVMPGGMSGPEMVEVIRQRRPDLPVLFASGYAEQALRDREALVGRARFIAKPYDGSDLTDRIERLLEGATP